MNLLKEIKRLRELAEFATRCPLQGAEATFQTSDLFTVARVVPALCDALEKAIDLIQSVSAPDKMSETHASLLSRYRHLRESAGALLKELGTE